MHTRRRIAELGKALFIESFREDSFPDFTPHEILAIKKYVDKNVSVFTTTPKSTVVLPGRSGGKEESPWQQIAIRQLEESLS